MHSNDVETVRTFSRRTGAAVADQTFPSDQAFEIVVDLEAGQTKHSDGGSYSIELVITDITANAIVSTATQTGTFGDATWPNFDLSLPFPVAAQGAGKQGHIYEAIAALTAGNVNPDVSFCRSPLFCITKP